MRKPSADPVDCESPVELSRGIIDNTSQRASCAVYKILNHGSQQFAKAEQLMQERGFERTKASNLGLFEVKRVKTEASVVHSYIVSKGYRSVNSISFAEGKRIKDATMLFYLEIEEPFDKAMPAKIEVLSIDGNLI